MKRLATALFGVGSIWMLRYPVRLLQAETVTIACIKLVKTVTGDTDPRSVSPVWVDL